MDNVLMGVQVVLSIVLILSILPQDKKVLFQLNLVEKEAKHTLSQKVKKLS